MKISVSFLKSNYSLDETISKINDVNFDGYFHVDILDGEYVESTKTDFDSYLGVLERANKPLDVHLMVNHPIEYINKLLYLKPKYITVHWDCLDNLNEISSILKKNNIKMGIALNPNDDVYIIKDYLNILDMVLIMSVFPGKGGQKFMMNIPYKLEHLNKLKSIYGEDYLIEVDGGINDITIKYVNKLVDLAVSGSYICCSDNYEKQINNLMNES